MRTAKRVAETSSALVSDYYIPDDGPTAPPLAIISWVTTIGSIAALSTVTYKVKNAGSSSRTFTLDQRGFGLDDRTLTRRIGDYTLSGGQELQGALTLSTLPVKSVSHSTQLTIQATLTHNWRAAHPHRPACLYPLQLGVHASLRLQL